MIRRRRSRAGEPPPAAGPAAPERVARSTLGSRARFSGDVGGAGDLAVHGRVDGRVRLRGSLAVRPGARVAGEVQVDRLDLAGALEGTLTVRGRLEAVRGSAIVGTASAGTWVVHEGARLEGEVRSTATKD